MHQNKSKSFIIGISGGSGSGKTSFIRDIKNEFSKAELCVLSQDDYYKPREFQKKDENGIENFDLPESLELEAFYQDLSSLTQGKTIERVEYTFNNNTKHASKLIFEPAPIIIVEGLFVFHEARVFNLMNLKMIINATDTQKIIRRIKRDRIERNYPLEDVLYRYEHHVLPSFERFINPFMGKVDVVINNNANYDLGRDMLISFIKNKLH